MKIPNWKTWPDQVFTLPAGLATSWFLAGYIDDPLSSGSFPLRLMVLAGFLCLCMAPGALIAVLLDWLRRPLPRTRLQATRPALWLRRAAWRRRTPNRDEVYHAATPLRVDDYMSALLRASQERKQEYIRQLLNAKASPAPEGPPVSYAEVKAAARQEGPLPVAPFSRAEGGMLVLVFAWCGAVLALALGSFAWLFVAKVLQGTVLACAGASLAAVCLVAAGDLALGVWVVRRTRDR